MISNAYDIDERTALDAKRPREKVAVPEPPGCRVSSAYDIDERVTAVIPEITYTKLFFIITNQKEFR